MPMRRARTSEGAVVDHRLIGHPQLIIDTRNVCARRGLAGDCFAKT
jgi:hypothetical protein